MSLIFVAGHNGLVGSAIVRRLAVDGIEAVVANRDELDLCDQTAVDAWFAANQIDQVYLLLIVLGHCCPFVRFSTLHCICRWGLFIVRGYSGAAIRGPYGQSLTEPGCGHR